MEITGFFKTISQLKSIVISASIFLACAIPRHIFPNEWQAIYESHPWAGPILTIAYWLSLSFTIVGVLAVFIDRDKRDHFLGTQKKEWAKRTRESQVRSTLSETFNLISAKTEKAGGYRLNQMTDQKCNLKLRLCYEKLRTFGLMVPDVDPNSEALNYEAHFEYLNNIMPIVEAGDYKRAKKTSKSFANENVDLF